MSSTTNQSPYKSTPTSTQFDTFIRWARLRKYRIEVTYGVYVFTPMEKLVFWTLFCFFSVVISTAMILYTHRSLVFLLRTATSYVDGRQFSGSLASHLLTAKRAATGLELMNGTAKNSQVA